MKKRLDQHLVDQGVFESRARAKAAVMEGKVTVDGSAAVKPGTQVEGDEAIVFEGGTEEFVSRGGIKLAHALDAFSIDVSGLVVLDAGSSTGGFTDCLLRGGAERVIALDVGKGQLHWKLRNDPRVSAIEGYNVRNLVPGDLPVKPALAVVDVSFISLTKVLGPIFRALTEGGEVVALVKPQFEAGRQYVEKGGVVKAPETHLQVLREVMFWITEQGLALLGVSASPIRGPKGNIEFFIWVAREGESIPGTELEQEVSRAHG